MALTSPPPGDEYSPVELGGGLHLLSLGLFLAALGSRLLVEVFPVTFRQLPPAFVAGIVTPLLALLGLLAGLAGTRSERTRALARLGVALNAIVLVLSLLLLAAVYRILPPEYRPF